MSVSQRVRKGAKQISKEDKEGITSICNLQMGKGSLKGFASLVLLWFIISQLYL